MAASWVKAAKSVAGVPVWLEALGRGLVNLPGFDLLAGIPGQGIFRGLVCVGVEPVGGYVSSRRPAINGPWGGHFGRPAHAFVSNWSRRGHHM